MTHVNFMRERYICRMPFLSTEIYEDSQYLCCPSWLPVNIKETSDFKKNFFSSKAEEVRKSILDGSYKFCDSVKCPFLSSLDKGEVTSKFLPKEEFYNKHEDWVNPRKILLGIDPSCNLECPSCRLSYINFKGERRSFVENEVNNVSKYLSDSVENITLCGSGDPFFSKTYFKFLKDFPKEKFPKLKNIHLHTNAILWTEDNWEKLEKIHDYVKSAEISVDAATKETYENKVRIGGKWDKLVENIKFISSIPSIKKLKFSFVVQTLNYKEMVDFYSLITNLTKKSNANIIIFFNLINNWGTYTDEEFKVHEIHNSLHPEFNNFLKEAYKVNKLNVIHNFKHLV